METEQDGQADSRLDELVFGYLERAEAEPSRAPAMLAELCGSHPALAQELRQRVELLVRSGLWKPIAAGDAEAPQTLGDFRLIRRLGQGGMGVVYLAEQISVGRRVALKLIRSEQLFFHGARLRFLREAQAIARMDHPNIVQVLTVGEEAGVPYLAMEYVEGCPLDVLVLEMKKLAAASGVHAREVVAARLEALSSSKSDWNVAFFERSWVELSLCIAREIADALQHAHQRGVLHRDVKPSNVLITPSGRVRLLDFGLAALSNESGLTRTGTQMGSLPYMAPEQIDGKSELVGPATDVYGVGVTLYELLSMRRAYDGANEAAVRKALLEARPTAIRALNPSVPVDVETVCAKAMESDPRRRYPSAAELSRDLANLLELRPIEARAPSALHRVVRWTQRRPAVATASVLGGLLVIAGPLGWELNRIRTTREVREAYERSERNFGAALQAIGHVLRDTATEELEDVPRMQRARLVALDRALELFNQLERERSGDLLVLFEGGELHKSRGDVLRDLGRPDEALQEYARAIDFQRRALARDGAPERVTHLAAALSAAGKAQQAVGRSEEALALHSEALGLQRQAAAADPGVLRWRASIAKQLSSVSESLRALGRQDKAERAARDGLAVIDELRAVEPESADLRWIQARSYDDLCAQAGLRDAPEEALEWAHRALAAYESASSAEPESRFYAFDVATGHGSVATCLRRLRRLDESAEHTQASLAIVEGLLAEFPDSYRYRMFLGNALEQLAITHGAAGRHEEASRVFEQRTREIEALSRAQPQRLDLALDLAIALSNLASGYVHVPERRADVAALAERSQAALEPLIASSTDNPAVAMLQRINAYNPALAACLSDRVGDARPLIEAFTREQASDAGGCRFAADLWNELLLALQRTHGAETACAEAKHSALDLLRRALDAGYDDIAELKSTPALEPLRGEPEFLALIARLESGD